MEAILHAGIGASAFEIGFQDLGKWKAALNCAKWLSLSLDGTEAVRVDLAGQVRWVAFQRKIDGVQYSCIGHQETVGLVKDGDIIISGSNRKTLAWLHPSGRVFIGDSLEDQ